MSLKRLGTALAAAGLASAIAPVAPARAEATGGTVEIALSNYNEAIQVGTDGDGKVLFASITATNAINPVLTVRHTPTAVQERRGLAAR